MSYPTYEAICAATDTNGAAKFHFIRRGVFREEYAIVTAGEVVKRGDRCRLAWDHKAQSYWVEMGSITKEVDTVAT